METSLKTFNEQLFNLGDGFGGAVPAEGTLSEFPKSCINERLEQPSKWFVGEVLGSSPMLATV